MHLQALLFILLGYNSYHLKHRRILRSTFRNNVHSVTRLFHAHVLFHRDVQKLTFSLNNFDLVGPIVFCSSDLGFDVGG